MAVIALVLGVVFGILLAIFSGFLLLFGFIKEVFFKPIKTVFR